MRVMVGAIVTFQLFTFQLSAQTPLDFGKSYRMQSRVLNETRVIDVSLPENYESQTSQRYPVVVVLDGEDEHEIAAAIARFYATMSQLPGLIVVGVRNTDRMRDLTTPPVAPFRQPPEAENAGGADKFLGFLADELIPHLDSTYRTTPVRVLIGHSLGGLFALHALAQRPQAFMGYVVMEPSAWWNEKREYHAARAALDKPASGRARVMMVNTEPWQIDTTKWGGTRPMVRFIEVRGETHGSMAMAGMMQGLRTLFADFRPVEWRAGMKPIEMLDRYDSLSARVGYAVPIPESAYALAIRMSIDSRYFDDAAAGLDRMERAHGASQRSRQLRDKLATDRAAPPDPRFVQLVVPARRPTPREAAAFLGRWVSDGHEVTVKASGDTIIVRNRVRYQSGEWEESDDPVIQVTADGTLEWGLPWFRGLAALVVLQGKVQPDGTMLVTREPRGWVPRQPVPEMGRTQRFRKAV